MAACSASNSSLNGTSGWPCPARWPSMMRRASSASSARTDSRTSPRSDTFSRKTSWVTSDETTDRMPLASSSPRTMLASTSDCVRKMTARSDMQRIDLHEDHRHVVVLRRVADKCGDIKQDALAQLLARQVRVFLKDAAEPRVAETVVGPVHRLADAVREEQIQVARAEGNGLLDEQPIEHPAVVQRETEHEPVGNQHL